MAAVIRHSHGKRYSQKFLAEGSTSFGYNFGMKTVDISVRNETDDYAYQISLNQREMRRLAAWLTEHLVDE